MAERRGSRVWPQRVSAVVAWLFAVLFLLEGVTGRALVLWPLAGVMAWLAIGVWKGRRRRAMALVVLGVLGAIWFTGWAIRSATFSETVAFDRNQLMEVRRPLAWTVILAVEAVLALVMAIGAVRPARAPERPGVATPEPSESLRP